MTWLRVTLTVLIWLIWAQIKNEDVGQLVLGLVVMGFITGMIWGLFR